MMAGGSHRPLTREEVEELLERLKRETPRWECWSCECLQGFIAQLEVDADEEAKPLPRAYKVPRKEMHECLGCKPCPPAEIFAEYLMSRRKR